MHIYVGMGEHRQAYSCGYGRVSACIFMWVWESIGMHIHVGMGEHRHAYSFGYGRASACIFMWVWEGIGMHIHVVWGVDGEYGVVGRWRGYGIDLHDVEV